MIIWIYKQKVSPAIICSPSVDNDDCSTFLVERLSSTIGDPALWTAKNLPVRNQLVQLRLNLPFEYLSYQTGISQSTVNATFQKIVDLMSAKVGFLVCWPDRNHIRKTLPPVFKQNFPRLTSIIDCFEIFIDRPKNLKQRAQVYSNYKKHGTVKYLISCSPLGAVTFLSDGWGGRATDVQIV